MNTLRLITAPPEEPLDVGFVKQHIRSCQNEEDALIALYIQAAREEAEKMRGEVFITQTWEMALASFPTGRGSIPLPRKPVQSITSITYTDEAGEGQTFGTLDGSPPVIQEYSLSQDVESPAVILELDQEWPTPGNVENAVKVRFVAGYGLADDVPASVKLGMAILVGWMNENREGDKAIPEWITRMLSVPKVG